MGVYSLDRIFRFKAYLLILTLLAACGHKPEIRTGILKSHQEVWEHYSQQYHDINSLALSGDLTIFAEKIHNCNLQLFYISPDSFAFTAEGTLGIDLARGAILGNSGFWEIPRQKFHDELHNGDRIYFENGDYWIDIEQLLQAVFFFRHSDSFQFVERIGSKYIYSYNYNGNKKIIQINRDSSTPVKQIFYDISDSVIVEYYNWNLLSGEKLFPRRMTVISQASEMTVEYAIKKVRVNPEIKPSFFLPKL